MTPKERQAMRERCDAATEGPWEAEYSNVFAKDRHGNRVTVLGSTSIPHEERMANALHQAHARTDLPACLDALEVAEKRCKLFEDALIGINTAVGDEPPEDMSDPAYYDYLMRVKRTIEDKDKRIAELEAALNGRRERIEQLEDELGPLRAFQRNRLPGGCE